MMQPRRPSGICDKQLVERGLKIWDFVVKTKGWQERIADCKLVYAEKGYVEFRMKPENRHMNPGNTMHGGCIGTIVDEVTAAAINTIDLRPMTSISINSTCIRAIPLGADVLLRAWVDKIGKNVAFAKIEFILEDSGKVAATGEHHMFFLPGQQTADNMKVFVTKALNSKL